MPAVTVQIDTGSTSSRGQPPGHTWLIRLWRGTKSVIIITGMSLTSAEHLAAKITSLLAEPEPIKALTRHKSIDRHAGATANVVTGGDR